MSYTNLTLNATNISSFDDVLKLANTTTNGTFWTGMFWMLIAIIFMASIAFGFEVAMILTFFAGMIIGMFLLYLGLISFTVFAMTEAILLFVVIYLVYTSNKN